MTNIQKKCMIYYMHTIESVPARFRGGQIVCCGNSIIIPADLATSLRQIRSEQNKTFVFRTNKGLDYSCSRYSYILVKVWE